MRLIDEFWRILRGRDGCVAPPALPAAPAAERRPRSVEALSGPINSANEFLVLPHGDLFVRFTLPRWAWDQSAWSCQTARVVLTRKEALRLGVWLLAIADSEGKAAQQMWAEIRSKEPTKLTKG